jgi:DNA-binding transcriptional ArsR family regulator
MLDKTFSEMDPVLETMGLLYVSYNLEEVKKETKKKLSELGFDGEQFYSQHLKTFDKYVQVFLKNRVEGSENATFFSEKDSNYFLILLSLIIENKSWLTSMACLSEDQINSQIFHICKTVFDDGTNTEDPDSLEDIIHYLDGCGLESDAKWKMLHIMQKPMKYISQLIEIINRNTDAYYRALSEVINPLEKLLNQYNVTVTNNGDKKFYELKAAITQSSVVYPTLIFPVSQMFFEKNCYYGLLSEKVIKNGKIRQNPKELLLLKLKALSDSSKLGIVSSLKVSPKYNLEIAQQLGLTAATMSHHMNVLLNCGLVGVEKRDGKVYYHLERENLQDLIKDLEETLL